MLRRRFAL